MALQGNIEFWKRVPDHDNQYEETITEPDGKEVTGIIVPEKWEQTGSEDNVYLIVRMAAIHMQDYDRLVMDENGDFHDTGVEVGSTKGPYYIVFRYNIYTSKNDRIDRFYNPLHEIDTEELIFIDDLNLDGKNLFNYCYDYLKTQKGFEQLTDI